jgi:hypothetical protein
MADVRGSVLPDFTIDFGRDQFYAFRLCRLSAKLVMIAQIYEMIGLLLVDQLLVTAQKMQSGRLSRSHRNLPLLRDELSMDSATQPGIAPFPWRHFQVVFFSEWRGDIASKS